MSEVQMRGREIANKIANFDFYRLSKILALSLKSDDDGASELQLTFLYVEAEEKRKYMVSFGFIGVQYLKLPEFAPHGLVREIEVEELSTAQLENIRFHFKAYGECELEVSAKGIEVLNCVDAGRNV